MTPMTTHQKIGGAMLLAPPFFSFFLIGLWVGGWQMGVFLQLSIMLVIAFVWLTCYLIEPREDAKR